LTLARIYQSPLQLLTTKEKEFKGFIWAIAEIDPALLSDDIERVNISLPKRVLARLDAKAKSAGENRSAFIAHMAISA